MAADHSRFVNLALIATILGLVYGIWYAYSVFLVSFLNEFGWSRSVIAGAFSTCAIVHGFANPAIGMLCDRIFPPLIIALGGVGIGFSLFAMSYMSTPLELYLSFGVVTAICIAACGWTPSVILVERRYHQRLGFALGIVSSGIGVGMLVVVPACQLLIDEYGWRFAYRALAIACAACIVPAALVLARDKGFAPRARHKNTIEALAEEAADSEPLSVGEADDVPRSITVKEATRTRPFWLMVAVFFFGGFASQTLHVHQVAFLVDHGISALIGSSVVATVGVASIVGKTGGGWLADRFERERVFVSGVSIMVLSVGVILLAGHTASIPLAYLFAVMLGIGYSATASIAPAMVSDRFRGENFGVILGVGLFGASIGTASGPWLAGLIFDLTGSYTIPFLAAALSGCLGMTAGWYARKLRLRTTG
ncbi:MAG: MFS transporter [Pseudomonadota bacterium]